MSGTPAWVGVDSKTKRVHIELPVYEVYHQPYHCCVSKQRPLFWRDGIERTCVTPESTSLPDIAGESISSTALCGIDYAQFVLPDSFLSHQTVDTIGISDNDHVRRGNLVGDDTFCMHASSVDFVLQEFRAFMPWHDGSGTRDQQCSFHVDTLAPNDVNVNHCC